MTDAPQNENPNPDPEGAQPVSRAKQRRLLVVLLAPLFMALIAVSVINVGLPAIQESLHASSSGIQWVLSGYALAFGVLLVPAGRVGDATGRKRMLLAGVAAFTLGSLLSGLAPNAGFLNLARILQGVGSGLLNPQVVGIIQQRFEGQARARAFALFGTTVAIATAVGPLVGGLLIGLLGEDAGWRWMFLMNVPIGLATIWAGSYWIPRDRVKRDKGERLDLDPVGTLLLGLGILLFMLPFLERSVGAVMWIALPFSVLVILVWVWWEGRYIDRGGEPMVDLGILRNKAFSNGIIIVSVYFLGSTSIWVVVPLYLQNHLEHTALFAALVGLPSSIVAAFSSQIGGRYVLRLGRRLVIGGFAVAAGGIVLTALTALAGEHFGWHAWVLAIPLTLIGLSQGMTISPNQTLTLSAVDPRYGGVAGGILQTGQRMGAAVGTAIIPGIVFSLVENGSPWADAFVVAMTVIAALSIAAMGVSIVDRKREKAGLE